MRAHTTIAQECAITLSTTDDNSVATAQEAILDSLLALAQGWSDVHDTLTQSRAMAAKNQRSEGPENLTSRVLRGPE